VAGGDRGRCGGRGLPADFRRTIAAGESDRGDPAIIAARCDEVADLLRDPECYGLPIAAVVLRRPAPARAGRGDRQNFRRLVKAAATRDTVPWSFYTAGPGGALPVLTREQRERYGC